MATTAFEPRIVAFFCNWCTYTAVGPGGHRPPRSTRRTCRVIRVMCSGRVDPQFVLKALRRRAPTACSSAAATRATATTRRATTRRCAAFRLLKRVLAQMGIEDARVRLEWISACEGDKVQHVINEMAEQVREARSLGTRGADHGGQTEGRLLLVRLLRRLRGGGRRPGRGDPRRRRRGGHRPLAGRHGLQAKRRRGDARQVHRRRLHQRRRPDVRAGGDGSTCCAGRRRWSWPSAPAPTWRHSRPGQPLRPRSRSSTRVYQDVPSQDNAARTVPGEHSPGGRPRPGAAPLLGRRCRPSTR